MIMDKYKKLQRNNKFIMNISIIIPVKNEEQNIYCLYEELVLTLPEFFDEVEIIFINDGSTDKTLEVLNSLSSKKFRLLILNNEENLGQGVSILKAAEHASFEQLVIMDGDLQVNPKDIIKLYKHWISNELDFVCSRRFARKDDYVLKHMPSKLGNMLVKIIFNTDFEDIGSSLKLLKKSHLIQMPKFKNSHRYFSIFLHYMDLRYEELPVEHRPRRYGSSNYHSLKFLAVLLELFKVRKRIAVFRRDQNVRN